MISHLFQVEREVPSKAIEGLLSGKYTLSGGTIRQAAGAANGGQIVSHLVPPDIEGGLSLPSLGDGASINPFSGISQASKLATSLGGSASQALGSMVQTTMVLSGINLGVTVVGFAVVIAMLHKQSKRLQAIEKNTSSINEFLNSERRSCLERALVELEDIEKVNFSGKRIQSILGRARDQLADLSFHYADQIKTVDSLEVAMAYQREFCLAFLALVKCHG